MRLAPRTDCEPDYEPSADAWLDQVITRSTRTLTRRTGRRAAPRAAWTSRRLRRRPPSRAPRHAAPAARPSARPAPVTARLAGNRLLSLPGAAKEVRRFTFDTSGTGLRSPTRPATRSASGRSTAPTWWRNGWPSPAWTPPTAVEVDGVGAVPLAEALHRQLDITRITPDLLRFVAERTRTTAS